MAPQAPGRVYMRREMNIGHSGVALYWSPGSDENWLSFYEIRRGAMVLGKVRRAITTLTTQPGGMPAPITPFGQWTGTAM